MADLLKQLEALGEVAEREIPAAPDARALDALRVRFLGKKGELSSALRGMGALDAEERPRVGEVANRVRDDVEALLSRARAAPRGGGARGRAARAARWTSRCRGASPCRAGAGTR